MLHWVYGKKSSSFGTDGRGDFGGWVGMSPFDRQNVTGENFGDAAREMDKRAAARGLRPRGEGGRKCLVTIQDGLYSPG